MEKLKRKKNKSEKEVSEVSDKSETKDKKAVALSKKEEKKEKALAKAKAVEAASKSSASKKSDEKKVSWNPFTKEGQYSIKVWFQGLKSELCKIIWPTKQQLIVFTIVVLVTLVSVSVYLFFLGRIFGWLFKGAGIV